MLNTEYVREILNNILSINKLDNIYFLNYKNNKNKCEDISLYTIYINPKVKSDTLGITIENILPFTHTVGLNTYEYNNISEDEICLLEKVLELLDIKVKKVSIEYLQQKKIEVSKKMDYAHQLIRSIKKEIDNYKEINNFSAAYLEEKKIEKIINDFSKVNVII